MIEVRTLTHVTRLFGDRTRFSDFFKLVAYFNYIGDASRVPWWYVRQRGHSCYIDLTKGLDEIFADMKSNTRNEIRRAERDGCTFVVMDGYGEFIPFYNAFCKNKGLTDFASETRMKKYQKLLVAKVVCGGTTMAMHSSILDEESRVALLQFSCSPRLDSNIEARKIGWANRYLHYKEFEWLKMAGYVRYDWSGVCVDPSSSNYSIGKFKLSFGGVEYDNCTLYSPLYAVAAKVKALVRKMWR